MSPYANLEICLLLYFVVFQNTIDVLCFESQLNGPTFRSLTEKEPMRIGQTWSSEIPTNTVTSWSTGIPSNTWSTNGPSWSTSGDSPMRPQSMPKSLIAKSRSPEVNMKKLSITKYSSSDFGPDDTDNGFDRLSPGESSSKVSSAPWSLDDPTPGKSNALDRVAQIENKMKSWTNGKPGKLSSWSTNLPISNSKSMSNFDSWSSDGPDDVLEAREMNKRRPVGDDTMWSFGTPPPRVEGRGLNRRRPVDNSWAYNGPPSRFDNRGMNRRQPGRNDNFPEDYFNSWSTGGTNGQTRRTSSVNPDGSMKRLQVTKFTTNDYEPEDDDMQSWSSNVDMFPPNFDDDFSIDDSMGSFQMMNSQPGGYYNQRQQFSGFPNRNGRVNGQPKRKNTKQKPSSKSRLRKVSSSSGGYPSSIFDRISMMFGRG